MIFLALVTLATGLLAVTAWRGRHDRPPATTLWLWGGAAALSILPFATLGTMIGGPADDWAVWAWAVLMLVYFPAAAFIVERKQQRDRRARMQLAIASGVPELEARRQYKRAPRTPWTIIVTYLWLVYVWVFAMVAVGTLFPATQRWLLADAFTLPPATAAEAPYPLPWFIAGVLVVMLAGMAHAFINTIRR